MVRPSLLLLGALSLTACVGALPHPLYAAQTTSALTPVEFVPPPGRLETIPPQPPAADTWIDGEWTYRHGRWFWLLGRWIKASPGARYAPWVCVHSTDGVAYYAPSVWLDAKGAPLASVPVPLAYATASGEAVFDPDGDVEDTGRNLKTPPPGRTSPEEQPAH